MFNSLVQINGFTTRDDTAAVRSVNHDVAITNILESCVVGDGRVCVRERERESEEGGAVRVNLVKRSNYSLACFPKYPEQLPPFREVCCCAGPL